MSEIQTYSVHVAILEGRHYMLPNMDSMVEIKFNNITKHTALKECTDCPYYNEHFVFDLQKSEDSFFEMILELRVFQPSSIFRKRTVLGIVNLDLLTVWLQPDHMFYHKWAILLQPLVDVQFNPRGYLKLDILIYLKGFAPLFPKNTNNDEIETNLLLPKGIYNGRKKANFIFDIYKCDIPNINLLSHYNTYIQVQFAGRKTKTSIKNNLIFNEQLIITELYPTLHQRIIIQIFHGSSHKPPLYATAYIYLRYISNTGEFGFLPTFGPNFLHFYEKIKNCDYLGSILIGINTEIINAETIYKSDTQILRSLDSINEEKYFCYQDVMVYAVILNVSLINKKYVNKKPIYFKMEFGNKLTMEPYKNSETELLKQKKITNDYRYLKIEEKKPLLTIRRKMPNMRIQMHHFNILSNFLDELKFKCDGLKNILSQNDNSINKLNISAELLESILVFIKINCEFYLNVICDMFNSFFTKLDVDKMNLNKLSMISVIQFVDVLLLNKDKVCIVQGILTIFTDLEILLEGYFGWPNIFIWMYSNNKKVGYKKLEPCNLLYSNIREKCGKFCGKVQSIYLEGKNQKSSKDFICKLDAIFLLGLNDDEPYLFSNLEKSFNFNTNYVEGKEKFVFECRAYVSQAKVFPGFDKSGLSDPFVQIILHDKFIRTKVVSSTLNPIWDECLVLRNISLFGSKEFISENPPRIVVELWDEDKFINEIIGRCEITALVKFQNEIKASYFPPKLQWFNVVGNFGTSELLITIELLETIETKNQYEVMTIPNVLKPKLSSFRLEALFWGVRKLKHANIFKPIKLKIALSLGEFSIHSDYLINPRKNFNFPNPIKQIVVQLPGSEVFAPSIYLKIYNSIKFGITVYDGVHISSVKKYLFHPLKKEAWKQLLDEKSFSTEVSKQLPENDLKDTDLQSDATKKEDSQKSSVKKVQSLNTLSESKYVDDSFCDWWTKFFSSECAESFNDSNIYKLTIYNSELEKLPEFGGFEDMLTPFELYKGKRTGSKIVDKSNITAILKGALAIYEWPLSDEYVTNFGFPLEKGIFQNFPPNCYLEFLLRVYCVRALGLRSRDLDNKSDPYIIVRLNDTILNDKKNYIAGELDPLFGRCFEIKGYFPRDHTLAVSVWDWDRISKDDLIGETKIDIENRFYTKHRASCGISEHYVESGPYAWRDQTKPTKILLELCQKYNLKIPEYFSSHVQIGSKVIAPENYVQELNENINQQCLALYVLRHWNEYNLENICLVPEHVETRSLYHPDIPEIEQGKLQMWIDIFPRSEVPFPPPVNITPRVPLSYQLRVIIWNTDEVSLTEDDFFMGERKSDIYVMGWLTDMDNAQYTDVHYRSLTGEGNFNWRFIFSFQYLPSERKMVFIKKKNKISQKPIVSKVPCKLSLQVWDNDTFGADDFIGSSSMELNQIPRGAKEKRKCNLSQMDSAIPKINLFKTRRTKGWWPVGNYDLASNSYKLTGKIELELELLSNEEAESFPAGLGRNGPQPLLEPNRPDTSFAWFKNPWKTFKHIVLKFHRWKFIKTLMFILLTIFIILGLYSFPGYTVKKFLGV